MLPQDPAILLSFINTKLRDEFPGLDELCAALNADREEIVQKLSALNYTYDAGKNRFV